ncbi:PAS-domain containing protein [Donghicola sp. XS_ASV15]|uniref:PAS-domain containing protein n=1 Tax=Donghicola sp. XS_ASV15 TaxID=3241295 RepID=UPI003513D047
MRRSPKKDSAADLMDQEAEAQGGSLIQTLTKTLAHLTVGVAIFDRDGRLVLFNPALMELSALPLDILTRRPRLLDFFDQLRSQGILPEPKDYTAWRKKYAELGENAPDMVEELWSLPSGLTYRVTAQSFRNGSMSLMIEDISNELSATRGIRARVRQNESILNSIDEPLCVYSGTGQLSFSNRAFKERWGTAEARKVGRMRDAIGQWQSQTAINQNWNKLAAFSERLDHRDEWSFDASFLDGDKYSVRVNPVTGGGTMLRFLRREEMNSLFETAHSRLQVEGARSIFATDGKAI